MCISRNDFLQMCQKVAMLPDRVCGIKSNVPKELTVMSDNVRYYPVALMISFDNQGNTINVAILHDMHANSIIHKKLEKVTKK